jgi:hypothetical protein
MSYETVSIVSVGRRKHKSVTPTANYGPPTLASSEIRYDPLIASGKNALLPAIRTLNVKLYPRSLLANSYLRYY